MMKLVIFTQTVKPSGETLCQVFRSFRPHLEEVGDGGLYLDVPANDGRWCLNMSRETP